MLPYLNSQTHYFTHKIKMKSTTVSTIICVFLFILVLLDMNYCEGCLKSEREALLSLNAQFDYLLNWEDNTDCCQWERVQCNTTTKRVVVLHLDQVMDYNRPRNWYINVSDFLAFEDLNILDLSNNSIGYFVEYEGSKILNKLDLLLRGNRIDGNVLQKSTMRPFSSISSLDLSFNHLNGAIVVAGLLNFSNLKSLDLSCNNITNFIVDEGSKSLTKLEVLRLDGNRMDGNMLRKSILPFSSISHLYLSDNQFSGAIVARDFCDLTNLEHLELEESSNLENEFFKSIGFLTSLKFLSLRGSRITGILPAAEWYKLKKLEELDLSDNKFEGSLPSSFCNMTSLSALDLYDNNFMGSFSSLMGTFELQLNRFPNIEFMGRISSNISFLELLDISNNHFVGELPSGWSKSFPHLIEILMSNNKFEGSIPSDFGELDYMDHLDLSENKLSGSVPSFLTHVPSFIHLNNNELSSLPKRIFGENSSSVMLDLSNNHIRSGIQNIIRDLSNHSDLTFLLLRGNYFTGQIPKELCQLRNISILDLSHNNFYGLIPNCLGKLPFDNNPDTLRDLLCNARHIPNLNTLFWPNMELTFTTKKRSNTYTGNMLTYMTGLDLSHNKLSGNIPYELGNLTKIRAMNLSYNNLKGKIPTTFSNLAQIESLDLSFNNLYGNVPPELNILSSLEVFSVAHNNLSGSLPEWKQQFLTFNESSFEGNPFLCGSPLQSCSPFIPPNASYTEEDYDDSVEMYIFWVSFGVSFTSALLVIAIILYINPYWRRLWFYYIELVITNCYYFIEDHVCKFPINI